jgi:hypothetical protein
MKRGSNRGQRVRKDPPMSARLAAVVLLHLRIPHDVAKGMTTKQILSMVAWDHYPVRYETGIALGWSDDEINHPSNLQPLIDEDHGLKTAKKDIPEIAKSRRLTGAQEAFQRKMLAKGGQNAPTPAVTRPKCKTLRGGKFKGHRKMDGTPVWRKDADVKD